MVVRIVVTGGSGMLGRDLAVLLRNRGHDVLAPARSELDVTSGDDVTGAVRGADAVVNCAAWTDVDAAEADEAAARAVNEVGAGLVARAAAARGARVVQVSTDYVFDGRARSPYAADAARAPLSAYGRSKAAGEDAARREAADHLIVRTAWLYGANARCFPRTIAQRAQAGERLSVVDDQRGQPTWTVDVAGLIERLLAGGAPPGTYHATSSGEATWFGFAEAVVAGLPGVPEIQGVPSSQYRRAAARPGYSVLGHDTVRDAGLEPIGPWRERWEAARDAVLAGIERR